MFKSLRNQIYTLGALTSVALVGLAALLLLSSWKIERAFQWTQHTERMLELARQPVDMIRQSESDLRASIIERDRMPSKETLARLDQALFNLRELVRSTTDSPAQKQRARALLNAAEKRVALLRTGINLQRSGAYTHLPFEQLRSRSLQSESLMAELDAKQESFVTEERILLAERSAQSEQFFARNRLLVLTAVPLIMLLILSVKVLTARSIRKQVHSMVEAIEKFASGDRLVRMDGPAVRISEFAVLADGYNAMADQLAHLLDRQAVNQSLLEAANDDLRQQSAALEARSAAMDCLNAMSIRLAAAKSDREFADVVQRFLPKLLYGSTGAVYHHSESRHSLVKLASWGDVSEMLPEWFEPDKCWGLRLVNPHFSSSTNPDMTCEHTCMPSDYHCEPLMSGGEVVGLLHVACPIPPEERYRLDALGRELGSALTNHLLQRNLTEQSIRDPLTDLFNRRYFEETLSIEAARAARTDTSLSIIMCDVDHFKRFNDNYGHDAGDAVLRAVAAQMRNHFRDGDIVCRYGGEEFTVIAPGATTTIAAQRVERLRAALSQLVVHSGNTVLPPVTVSFGISGFAAIDGKNPQRMLEAADEALYRAKRQGRNRTAIADLLAA